MHRSARATVQALRSRLAVVSAILLAGAAVAGGRVPLLAVPGLELGLGAALVSAIVLGPALGIAAARREDAASSADAVMRAFVATAVTVTVIIAIVLGSSAMRAAIATPCGPLVAAPVFALVAFPSGIMASAVAVAAAAVARGRRWPALLLYALVVLASLAAGLLVAYFGPAASIHDHLLGVWPGPLYDEAVEVDARLVLFRVGTIAWSGLVLALATLVVEHRRRRGLRSGPLAAAVCALLVAFVARAAGGAEPTRADIASVLGAVREGPRCVVHLPAERGPAYAERALRDCEYDAYAVTRALGLAHAPRATVWIYRDAEEKKRLVGAGQTNFTKPWLAEIHLNDRGVPEPVLRHELVHALASVAATGPLRVPARAGVIVNAGLVEGLAVAVDVPSGDDDVHAWARAMRDQGLLPPIATLMQPTFFEAPAARAYTAAGSFLRFLLDRYGAARVLAAYHDDDVARGVGRPLRELDREWQRFLDQVVVPPALAAAAAARFERGSLFTRTCAREIAVLQHAAEDDASRGRPAAAERALRRASTLSGGDPSLLRGAVEAWRAAGDLARAGAIAREALAATEAAGGHRALRVQLVSALGDLRLREGDTSGAAKLYRAALGLAPGRDERRMLEARIAIAEDGSLRFAAAPWLLQVGDPGVALSRLAESGAPLARYLLARARLARGAPALALADLARLDPADLPDRAFAVEVRRMAADASCSLGRWDGAIAAWRGIAQDATTTAHREQADDAAARCAFQRDAYGVAVPWDGDWPAPSARRGERVDQQ